ncbi:MAG: hypothetical protein WCI34_02545 [Actinomycetes bacterium]|uniref:Unannotated protein n=1 Tax=freshwater metagenome TaxID=449393 RepID=A0A6J7EAM8_9ZZZZ|nr:hypothetical protein [Actinomycetota bacterium]
MNAQRAEAYLKVIAVLDTESGVTLRPDEAAALRHTADVLFFDEDGRSEALEASTAVIALLVESERWSEERTDRLTDNLEGCGELVPA